MVTFSEVEEIGSRSLRIRATRLDFPLPVRPQIAIFSPDLTVNSIFRRARLSALSGWSSGLKSHVSIIDTILEIGSLTRSLQIHP